MDLSQNSDVFVLRLVLFSF